MPKLWRDTIDAHREDVRDAILDAAEKLAAAHGPLALSMSQIAETAGIGRATLYKYFPDVETILESWHERHVQDHLARMTRIADGNGDAEDRLAAVLEEYAGSLRRSHHGDLGAVLHRHKHVAGAHRQLTILLERLIADAADEGSVRTDVPAGELATYCIHALAAARHLRGSDAARRLLGVTLDALTNRE